jgi:hypothetical protein
MRGTDGEQTIPRTRFTNACCVALGLLFVLPTVTSFSLADCRTTDGHTLFGNASICTEAYSPTNPPLVIDLNCSLLQS